MSRFDEKSFNELLFENKERIVDDIMSGKLAGIALDDLIDAVSADEKLRKSNAILFYNKGEKIHNKQIAFHKDRNRLRVLLGGNRTGKSVAGACEGVYWSTGMHPYRNIATPNRGWVVSLTNEVQRDVAQKEILRWLPKKKIYEINVRTGKKDDPYNSIIDFIVLKNRSVIGFKTVEQGREKFQGTSQDWIWFDEEPDKTIYDECKMRLIDTRGSMWMTMTPLKGLTWVYDTIYLNEVQDPEIRYWCMEWADNPHLSKDEIIALESTLTIDEREARQYGRFVALSGLVYKEFKEDINVIEPFKVPVAWHDAISIDPGYTNPTAVGFFACDGDGDVYLIAEHYEKEHPIEYHAKKIKEIADSLGWKRTRTGKLAALIDSAANQRTSASQRSTAEIYRENGIICNTEVNKDVWSGIQRVKHYLMLKDHPEKKKYPKGKPKLFIFENCVNTIREFKSYRWAEPREGVNNEEKPKKANDHTMDLLRYYIMSKPDPFVEGQKPKYIPGGKYYMSQLKLKGFTDLEINRLVKHGKIELLRH